METLEQTEIYYHTCKDGRVMTINGNVEGVLKMEDVHLRNTVAFQRKKALEGFIINDEECYGLEVLEHMNHQHYYDEAVKRRLL
jgi:hypothetical protein